VDRFKKFCIGLFQKFPDHLEAVKLRQNEEQAAEEHTMKASWKSLKVIPLCTHYMIIINSIFELKHKDLIESVIQSIFESVAYFPESILSEVKNMNLYMDYIDTLSKCLSFFTFILKKNYTDLVI
jgi:hypothetical protein